MHNSNEGKNKIKSTHRNGRGYSVAYNMGRHWYRTIATTQATRVSANHIVTYKPHAPSLYKTCSLMNATLPSSAKNK